MISHSPLPSITILVSRCYLQRPMCTVFIFSQIRMYMLDIILMSVCSIFVDCPFSTLEYTSGQKYLLYNYQNDIYLACISFSSLNNNMKRDFYLDVYTISNRIQLITIWTI